METLKYFLSAFLCMGFIYFLIIRAMKNTNYMRKAIFSLISGSIITIIFIGGFIYDLSTDNVPYPNGKYDITYFAYLIASIIYTLLFFVIFFIKAHSRKQKFKMVKNKKEKVVPTIKDKKEFVYIIFKLNGNILLNKEIINDIDTYNSLVIKFPHNEFFHDEIVKKFIKDNNLDCSDYKLIGKAIKHDKKDNIYYCYQINLNQKTAFLNDYLEINLTDLVNMNLEEIDKKIIFTSIIQKDFEIDL